MTDPDENLIDKKFVLRDQQPEDDGALQFWMWAEQQMENYEQEKKDES